MAPASRLLALRHGPAVSGSSEPLAGIAISVALSILSASALSAFTTQRYLAIKTWKQLPLVQWLVFAIYADSFLFVLATGILQFGFGVGYSGEVCESAILLCLICYVTTKLIYLFLVEKAYIIRSSNKKPRLKSKLYLFNSFGMIGAYCVVVVPNFVLRFAKIENGECIIGMQRPAMIPLIVFDLLVNIYLTIIFLRPLSSLYSYKHVDRAPGNQKLRTMATKTFAGCICTLISSIVNLSVLVGLNGEPGWVCLMCCNSDILFSAAVIHWVTSRDSTTTASPHADDTVPRGSSPRSHHNTAILITASHHGGGGGSTGTGESELSAIPAHAARQRLPDGDEDYDDGEDGEEETDRESVDSLQRSTSASSSKPDGHHHIHMGGEDDGDGGKTERDEGGGEDRGGVVGDNKEDAERGGVAVPAKTHPHHHQRAAGGSEVRVDVDYGATTTVVAEGGERLGNTVVIGIGGRRGRRRSGVWR